MPRIKLFVNLMPPRPVEVPSTQSPQKPSNCEVRFAVTASERWQIGDLWKHIKVEHSKAYGKDTRARWVKLQGTEGEDLPNHERVGDMWNVHMGKADRHVFVVRDMFDRETSLAPDSTLLPPVGTPSAFGSDREVPRSARSSSLFQRRIQAVRDTPTRESDSERGSLAESVGEDQEQPTHAVVEVEEDAELMVDEDNFKIPRLPRRLKDAKEAELQLQRESQQSQQSQQSQLSSSPFAPSSYHRSPLVNDVVIRDSQDDPPTPQLPSSSVDFEPPDSAQRPPREWPIQTPRSCVGRGFISQQPQALDVLESDPIQDDNDDADDVGLDGVTDSDLERAEASTQDTRITPRSTTDPTQRLVQSARDASKSQKRLNPSDRDTPEGASRSARIPNRLKTTFEKWTDAEDSKLLQGLRKGWTVEKILSEYGISRSGGSARARKFYLRRITAGSKLVPDLPPASSARARQQWTEDEVRKIRLAMCQGCTVAECRIQYFPTRSIESIEHKMRALEVAVFEACKHSRTLPKDGVLIKGWTMREDFKLRRAYREKVSEHTLCRVWFPQVDRRLLVSKWRQYLRQMRNETPADDEAEITQMSTTSRVTIPSSPVVVPSSPLKGRSGRSQAPATSTRAQRRSPNEQQNLAGFRSSPPAEDLVNGNGSEAHHPPEPTHVIRTLQFVKIPVSSPAMRGESFPGASNEASITSTSQINKNASTVADREETSPPIILEIDQRNGGGIETTGTEDRQTARSHKAIRDMGDALVSRPKQDKLKIKERATRVADVQMASSVVSSGTQSIAAMTPAPKQHVDDISQIQLRASSAFEGSLSALRRRNKRLATKPRPDVFDFSAHIDQDEDEMSDHVPEPNALPDQASSEVFPHETAPAPSSGGIGSPATATLANNTEHGNEQDKPSGLRANPQPSENTDCQLAQHHTELMPEAALHNNLFPPNAKLERRSWELSEDEVQNQAKERLLDPSNQADFAFALQELKDVIAIEKAAYFENEELRDSILQKRKQRLREARGKTSTTVDEDGVEEIRRIDSNSDSDSESMISLSDPFGEPSYVAAGVEDEDGVQQDFSASPTVHNREIIEIDEEEDKDDPFKLLQQSTQTPGVDDDGSALTTNNPSQSAVLNINTGQLSVQPQEKPQLSEENGEEDAGKKAAAPIALPEIEVPNLVRTSAEGNGQSEQFRALASQQEAVSAALAGTGVPRSSARSDSSSQSTHKSQVTNPSIPVQRIVTSQTPNIVTKTTKRQARENCKKRKRMKESDLSFSMPPPPVPIHHTETVPSEKDGTALTATSSFSDISSRDGRKRRRQNKRSSLQRRSEENLRSSSSVHQNLPTPTVGQSSQSVSFTTVSSGANDDQAPSQAPVTENDAEPEISRQRPFEAIWQQLEYRTNTRAPTPPPQPKSKQVTIDEAFAHLKHGSSSGGDSDSDSD